MTIHLGSREEQFQGESMEDHPGRAQKPKITWRRGMVERSGWKGGWQAQGGCCSGMALDFNLCQWVGSVGGGPEQEQNRIPEVKKQESQSILGRH